MDSDKKIDKAVVVYLERKGTNYTCRDCVFYDQKRCKLYGPNVSVKAWGGCNLWVQSKAKDIPMIGGVSKGESGYMENKEGFSCKRCEEFLSEQKACKKIAGAISKDGCCNRWEKK